MQSPHFGWWKICILGRWLNEGGRIYPRPCDDKKKSILLVIIKSWQINNIFASDLTFSKQNCTDSGAGIEEIVLIRHVVTLGIRGHCPDVSGIVPDLCAFKKKKLPNDENSPKDFYVVAYRMASSHKCNIVTSANCTEVDLAFLVVYAHGQSNSFQMQHQCYSLPLYASLILPEPVY